MILSSWCTLKLYTMVAKLQKHDSSTSTTSQTLHSCTKNKFKEPLLMVLKFGKLTSWGNGSWNLSCFYKVWEAPSKTVVIRSPDFFQPSWTGLDPMGFWTLRPTVESIILRQVSCMGWFFWKAGYVGRVSTSPEMVISWTVDRWMKIMMQRWWFRNSGERELREW